MDLWEQAGESPWDLLETRPVLCPHALFQFRNFIPAGRRVSAAELSGDIDTFMRLSPLLLIVLVLPLTWGPAHGLSKSHDAELLDAAARGDVEKVKSMLDKGTTVNVFRDGEGSTPLILACNNGHLAVAKLLLDKGAAINQSNRNGWTPLMGAASKGSLELAKLLLKNGADLSARHAYGWTAEKIAAQKGHKQVVDLLVNKRTMK